MLTDFLFSILFLPLVVTVFVVFISSSF